ncbi:MAG: carboxypeptidase-like regulatory domain-containing protein [Bryobacteraceae bacterium]|nr:carboxypeptidase-like regulatory domain-containing protein [Bryobacteraceae bacterium]MDW8379400.1 carboxypeptidase-like regulatory domain-containing protein [Bryobacterales bacterium]
MCDLIRMEPWRGLLASILVVTLAPWSVLHAQLTIPGAPASMKLTVKEGDGALNNIKAMRAKEPVVLVTDANDRPLAGASVTFLLPELGPGAMFPEGYSTTVTTGPDGLAVGRGMRPNNVVGPFEIRVVASYQGQTARAVIKQTNAAPQASSGSGKKAAILVAVLGGAGAAVALGVTRSGKSNPSQPGGTSISAGGSTFGPPR